MTVLYTGIRAPAQRPGRVWAVHRTACMPGAVCGRLPPFALAAAAIPKRCIYNALETRMPPPRRAGRRGSAAPRMADAGQMQVLWPALQMQLELSFCGRAR